MSALENLKIGGAKEFSCRTMTEEKLNGFLIQKRNGVEIVFPQHKMTLVNKPLERPTSNNVDWKDHAYKFIITIYKHKTSEILEEVEFYVGRGHTVLPQIIDVFYTMHADWKASQTNFDDFCANLGYSSDSVDALNTYINCQQSGTKLHKIFGKEVEKLDKFYENY